MSDVVNAKPGASLHDILALHTRLTRIGDEQSLLEEALTGICQILDLQSITCFERHLPDDHWAIRATTDPTLQPGHHLSQATIDLLQNAAKQDGGVLRPDQGGYVDSSFLLAPLKARDQLIGMMLARIDAPGGKLHQPGATPLLLQLFAQNLGSLWHSLTLSQQVQQQAQALEILQGKYVDSIWQTQTAALQASYGAQGFAISRQITTPPPQTGHTHPLFVGSTPFGTIHLPDDASLNAEQTAFLDTLVHEMGNALNNAYLLQTTRTYANQLALATEVTRAATTILDQDILIQEVVNLIRSGFDLYYVGLFMVDVTTQTAVLHAGTGEAGEQQTRQGHHLKIGGPSMIGTAIAQGKAIVEQDVMQAAAFTFNPLLPDTRAELALPLRTRGRIVVGALTVQSVERYAFADETVAVLQNLADQLAIAIETASLFAQTQATLAETSHLYETSRRMSAAEDETAVYQALIDFAVLSELVDAAQIITSLPNDPEFIISPIFWNQLHLAHDPEHRYPRQMFSFWGYLAQNDLVTISNINTDPRLDNHTRQFYAAANLRTAAFIPIQSEREWLATFALYRATAKPLVDADLQPFQTLADQAAIILANQRLLGKLQAANEQLRQLDQLKTQFLANMSHELRTPLNSIIGFSRVILKGIDGPINADQQEDLTSIYNNGQHLLRLINEILDMAKIGAGKMVLSFEPVNLEEAAMTAISTIRSLTNEKGLDLVWDIAPDLPLITADPMRVRHIFNNLLSNAVKYTDEGQISLQVRREDAHHISITVSDTGIGISQADFDKLFAAFEQIDSSTTRTVGGTGLGLPITKWLVDMHQGTITLESEVGKGSTFHVILPIERNLEMSTEVLTFDKSLQP